jgi:hypothetical protein
MDQFVLISGIVDGSRYSRDVKEYLCFHFILAIAKTTRQRLGFCEWIAFMVAGVIRASYLSYPCGGGVAPKPRHC